MYDGDAESWQHVRQIQAKVETILNLGHIAMSVLPESKGMMRNGYRHLQVAKEDVQPFEGLRLATEFAFYSFHNNIFITQLLEQPECLEVD